MLFNKPLEGSKHHWDKFFLFSDKLLTVVQPLIASGVKKYLVVTLPLNFALIRIEVREEGKAKDKKS